MYVQPPDFALHTAYASSRGRLERSMERLSHGERFKRPGDDPGGDLSAAMRFKHKVRRGEASTNSLQTALSYLNATDQYAQTVQSMLHRMTEIAASASDGGKNDSDRTGMDEEFQILKREITEMSRNATFNGMQTIGRDVMVSYDASSEQVKFFNPAGDNTGVIARDFGSADVDANGVSIGFDASEDFSMSRDGKSLFFLGTVAGDAAGVVRMKRYDIETHTVDVGTDLFATGDTLFVDEAGDLRLNGSGTLYDIDKNSLAAAATAVTDMTSGTEFSVYKGDVTYYRSSDNNIVSYNMNSLAATSLTGAITFAAGAHSISASGKYIAEESPAGSIRVIDTRSGDEATLSIGGANSITDLHFNEDGDRIYFVNQDSNSINYVSVASDENGILTLRDQGVAAQGRSSNSFNGLDLGGANYNSAIDLTVANDTVSFLKYEAVDLNTYILGIANTHVDNFDDANAALEDLREAMTRVSFRRAKLGAQASRLDHVMQSHRGYLTNARTAYSQMADIDIAQESMEFSASQVRNQAASAILAQFNAVRRNVLSLLQF